VLFAAFAVQAVFMYLKYFDSLPKWLLLQVEAMFVAEALTTVVAIAYCILAVSSARVKEKGELSVQDDSQGCSSVAPAHGTTTSSVLTTTVTLPAHKSIARASAIPALES
jgi:hypothetical protein